MHARALVFALLAAASLAACDRGAGTGATAKGGAPGSSGNAVVGATGNGSGSDGSKQAAQPGVGLNGGLGTSDSTKASGAGPAPSGAAASQGSTNLTRKSSVGNR